jgi:hypothetical protein
MAVIRTKHDTFVLGIWTKSLICFGLFLVTGNLFVSAEPQYIVNAVDYTREWDYHALRAEVKYVGKEIQITGKISDITKTFDGKQIKVTLEQGTWIPNLYLYLPLEYQSALLNYDKGDNITVTGIVENRYNIEQCKLLQQKGK